MTDHLPTDGLAQRITRAPRALTAAQIEQLTGHRIENADGLASVDGLSTLEVPADNCFVLRDRFVEDDIRRIEAFRGRSTLFALPQEYRGRVSVPAIFTSQPREIYIPLAIELFNYFGSYWLSYEKGSVAQQRYPDSTIMPGCHIHRSARIGAGSMVFPGAFIGPNVILGRTCLVKPNPVIGMGGFGIHVDDCGNTHHLPHIGGVVVGDDVEIGSLNTVCSGTIHPTVISDMVKIDDHVHVGHNVQLGAASQAAAHAGLGGSITYGRGVFVGPNAVVGNGAAVGEGAIIGIGAVVLKEVPAHKVVVGNPARVLRDVN